jgi:hypothetical protein
MVAAMMRDDDCAGLYFTDVHETGHAIAGRVLLGCRRCGHATIIADDQGRAGYAVVRAGTDVQADIIVSLAGPAAENLLARLLGDEMLDGADKLKRQHVARLAAQHGLTEFELNTLHRRARRLVRKNWSSVRRVAQAPLRDRILDGRAIDELVQQ